jgi:ABC-type methionine transport system ATPase subunit
MQNIENITKNIRLQQTLLHSDLNKLNDFSYGTLIVTGNYERQELNAFIANLWAHHFNTHVV